jgi:hypothetical protein
MRPRGLTDDDLRFCRRLARGTGAIAIYARMALAADQGRGIRLSSDEVIELMEADESNMRALWSRIEDQG